jgi:hypothetical protein
MNTKPYIIFSFFGSIVPYCKDDFHKKQFEDDLVLFITKDLHVFLSFVEAPLYQTKFSIKTKVGK